MHYAKFTSPLRSSTRSNLGYRSTSLITEALSQYVFHVNLNVLTAYIGEKRQEDATASTELPALGFTQMISNTTHALLKLIWNALRQYFSGLDLRSTIECHACTFKKQDSRA